MPSRPAILLTLLLAAVSTARAEEPDYARHIKPLLHEKCAACHGALKQKASLRLDAIQLLRRGGDAGPVITPGRADTSLLVHAVEGTHDAEKMPVDGAPLTAPELKLLRAWIDAGAKGPDTEPVPADPKDHWAFKPPARPALPPATTHRIDALINADLASHRLTPLPVAPRHILLRRLYIDLVGVPPTVAELRAFLADDSPAAYEAVVDRLLADPRYGQRWGRHWLDVWRYSDWAGYKDEQRESKPGIWRWRDWAIESVQADKPYDRMLQEMLAADELCPDDAAAQRATGYLARSWFKFNRHIWMDNTVEHASKAFLGLTINCARCHDHKYDPISQAEYYQLRAFFEPMDIRSDPVAGSTDPAKDGLPRAYDKDPAAPTYLLIRGEDKRPDTARGSLPPLPPAIVGRPPTTRPVELPASAYYPGLRPEVRDRGLKAAQEALTRARADLHEAITPDAHEYTVKSADAKAHAVELELAAVQARLAADAARYQLPDRPKGSAEDLAKAAALADRAAALAQAASDLVAAEKALIDTRLAAKPANAKSVAAATEAEKKLPALRKALAAAETASAKPVSADYKPLTVVYPKTSTGRRLALARWIASAGNPLTARVAVNHIWMRHFGEPLVPTVFDFGLNGRPPTHPKLLDDLACELMEHNWSTRRLHRLIVTSAAYRRSSSRASNDQAYAANEQIDPDNKYLCGANVRRMEAEAVRDSLLHVAGKLDLSTGGPELDQNAWQTTHRRSLYYRHAQDKQGVFAMVFDAPSPNECYRRAETITPQQSLALANSPMAVSNARLLAADLSKQFPPPDQFVSAAFERILSRPPAEAEHAECLAFLQSQTALLNDPAKLTAHAGIDAPAVPASKEPAQRAREDLVHVLFNHNDFVTVR